MASCSAARSPPGGGIALSGPAQSGNTWLAVQFLLAAEQGGFKTIFHFSRVFKQETGHSPRHYRNARGMI